MWQPFPLATVQAVRWSVAHCEKPGSFYLVDLVLVVVVALVLAIWGLLFVARGLGKFEIDIRMAWNQFQFLFSVLYSLFLFSFSFRLSICHLFGHSAFNYFYGASLLRFIFFCSATWTTGQLGVPFWVTIARADWWRGDEGGHLIYWVA